MFIAGGGVSLFTHLTGVPDQPSLLRQLTDSFGGAKVHKLLACKGEAG
jgi:hypothetical protein